MKAIILCFLLISQAFTLSLRNRMKVLSPTQQQKIMVGFLSNLLKDNVKFSKRTETNPDATVYEIWVYKDNNATPEENEQLDDVVEEITEEFVEHLPEHVDDVLTPEQKPVEPEEGIKEEEPTPAQEAIEDVLEELPPKQEEKVEQLLQEEQLSPKQEEELKEVLEEELPPQVAEQLVEELVEEKQEEKT